MQEEGLCLSVFPAHTLVYSPVVSKKRRMV